MFEGRNVIKIFGNVFRTSLSNALGFVAKNIQKML